MAIRQPITKSSRRRKPFDPKTLSLAGKLKHARKPDVINVKQGRIPNPRRLYGYKMVRVGGNIQFRKIKGPAEARIDSSISKAKRKLDPNFGTPVRTFKRKLLNSLKRDVIKRQNASLKRIRILAQQNKITTKDTPRIALGKAERIAQLSADFSSHRTPIKIGSRADTWRGKYVPPRGRAGKGIGRSSRAGKGKKPSTGRRHLDDPNKRYK